MDNSDTEVLAYHQEEPKIPLRTHIVELFQTLVVFAAIGTAIYWLIAQPHKVSGSSMFPNFKDGDYIITDKVTYRLSEPTRGDIIVFKNPRDESQDFIKRIIAVPGDRIKVSSGKVYLNGKLLDEPYLNDQIVTNSGSFMKEGEEVEISPNHFIVLGDNRSHSSDSREWGFIQMNEIIGKVFFRYWPANEIGLYPAYYQVTN